MLDNYKKTQMINAKKQQDSGIYCDNKIDFDKQNLRL